MEDITKTKEYVRSLLFGAEDSLVSTTGLIAGMSAGAGQRSIVLLAAVVGVTIEALSMAAGEFLSEEAAHEMARGKRFKDSPLLSGILMFMAYVLAGLIPILPIIFFSYPLSISISVIFALSGLFLLGYFKGMVVKVSPFKSGLRILLIGGIATLLGVIVGMIFKGM